MEKAQRLRKMYAKKRLGLDQLWRDIAERDTNRRLADEAHAIRAIERNLNQIGQFSIRFRSSNFMSSERVNNQDFQIDTNTMERIDQVG